MLGRLGLVFGRIGSAIGGDSGSPQASAYQYAVFSEATPVTLDDASSRTGTATAVQQITVVEV